VLLRQEVLGPPSVAQPGDQDLSLGSIPVPSIPSATSQGTPEPPMVGDCVSPTTPVPPARGHWSPPWQGTMCPQHPQCHQPGTPEPPTGGGHVSPKSPLPPARGHWRPPCQRTTRPQCHQPGTSELSMARDHVSPASPVPPARGHWSTLWQGTMCPQHHQPGDTRAPRGRGPCVPSATSQGTPNPTMVWNHVSPKSPMPPARGHQSPPWQGTVCPLCHQPGDTSAPSATSQGTPELSMAQDHVSPTSPVPPARGPRSPHGRGTLPTGVPRAITACVPRGVTWGVSGFLLSPPCPQPHGLGDIRTRVALPQALGPPRSVGRRGR